MYFNELRRKQAARVRGFQHDQGSFAGLEEHDAFYRLLSAEVDGMIGSTSPTVLETEPPREQA